MTEFLITGPENPQALLMLAHGAGAGMTHPFMADMAGALAERGIGVARFNFAYMAARADGGKKGPPPRAGKLLDEYRATVAAAPDCRHLFIGGKSMGGRIASMIAGELFAAGRIAGLVCIGYPFHPPKKPDALRTAHLAPLKTPALIVQGERDPFGKKSEVAGYDLSVQIALRWIPGGDHDLKPNRAAGLTQRECLSLAADAIADFISTQ